MTDERTGKQYLLRPTETLIHDVLQQVCRNHGGRLPEPKDDMENTFLDDLITGTFMLGMTDKATEGRWVWDSNRLEVNWQYWMAWRSTEYTNEPNGGDGENCVVMAQQLWNDRAGHKTDGWLDVPCYSDDYIGSKSISLICERKRGLFT